jgi:hypothetical protein
MSAVLVAGLGLSLMQLVGVAFFVGFFVAAGVAIHYATTPYVRKGFLGGFFALLLVVALVGPVQPLPLIQWHKFSHPVPEEQQQYQLRVVDGQGRELQYDVAATLSVDGAYLHRYLDDFVEADAAEQRRVGSYLVDRANVHKSEVQNPPLTRSIRYPPGYVRERWTPEKVSRYGEFVGLRVYEITTTTTPDGREVTNVEEELVFEQFYDDATSASVAADDADSTERHESFAVDRSLTVDDSPRAVGTSGGLQGVSA